MGPLDKVLAMRAIVLAVLAVLLLPWSAGAQSSRFDVGAALGRVHFGGESPPNVKTIGIGATVWVTDRFGVAWSTNVGSDMVPYVPLVQPPFPQSPGDRRLIERGNVRLHRVTLRYRRMLWPSALLIVGGGILVSAALDEVVLVAETLTQTRTLRHRETWSGLSFESLLRQSVGGPVAVEAGLIVEGALDRRHYQPVVQLTCSF